MGGAINFGGQSYILVDGGVACGYNAATNVTTACNGTIQNTANGTSLTYQQASLFIEMGLGVGNEVKNMSLQNMYQRSGTAAEVDATTLRAIDGGSGTVTIDHNVINMGGWCVTGSLSATTLNFYNNDISNCEHDLAAAPTTFFVHDNHFHDWAVWDNAGLNYHHDGFHCFAGSGGNTQTGYLYNNQFDGDTGTTINQFFFPEGGGSSTTCMVPGGTLYVFNNVFLANHSTPAESSIVGNSTTGDTGDLFANNTSLGVSGANGSIAYQTNHAQNVTIENNATGGNGILVAEAVPVTYTVFDYNAYENCSSYNCFYTSFVDSGLFTVWQAGSCTGSPKTCDQHGIANLSSSTYFALNSACTVGSVGQNCAPQFGSPLIQAGANLSSLCTGNLAPLCSDRAGNPRPATGAWDIGAYQAASSDGPLPPTSLTAVPQ